MTEQTLPTRPGHVRPDAEFFTTDTEGDDAQFANDDLAAYWYAYGRLDQGHSAVVVREITGITPSPSDTAWHFGRMWARGQREYRDPQHPRIVFPSMQSAWETYAMSSGSTIFRDQMTV